MCMYPMITANNGTATIMLTQHGRVSIAKCGKSKKVRCSTVQKILKIQKAQELRTLKAHQKIPFNHGIKASTVNLLKTKGIEPTTLRIKIAAVLLSKIQHLTVAQIRRELKHSSQMISDNAMIKTLQLFDAHNVIREVYVDSNTIFYDSNTCLHLHFFNARTGELVDIPATDINIHEATCSRSIHDTNTELR